MPPKPRSESQVDEQGFRHLTDPQTMRALAHPVRLALLESLSVWGPLTATEAGERIGESATTCSFHLRQLASYGFVEEAGGGKGRARPWRMTATGLSMSTTTEEPEADIAALALARMFRERQLDRYRLWLETRGSYPPRWQRAAAETDAVLFLTAAEATELNNDIHALVRSRFPERRTDPAARPPGSVPVELLLVTFPTEMPSDEEPEVESP